MAALTRFLPRLAVLAALLFVTACEEADLATRELEPMGAFKLGHNIVVAPDPQLGPLSRRATEAEWQAAMSKAIDDRFGRYDGDRFYHIAIAVNGYVLAQPGIPVVASPKSVLIIGATVWDDVKGVKLNDEPEQITVLESLSGDSIVGSGLTLTKQEQMANLSRNAARAVQKWMLEHPEWFDVDPNETPAN